MNHLEIAYPVQQLVHKDGSPVSTRRVTKATTRDASAGQPSGSTPVRHTPALMLHRAGVAPADVASMLGHSVGTHLTFYVPKTERGAASATRLGSCSQQRSSR